MTRLRHRETGSVIDVPDEKVARLYGMGYDVADEVKKAPAKKAASSKSDTK